MISIKSNLRISGLVLLILLISVYSCEKKNVPTLTTTEVTDITGTTAISGGSITDEGSGVIVQRGICWSKSINPAIGDNLTAEGGGTGTFTSNLSNLEGESKYYVRAYATNKAGTGYGNEQSFTTPYVETIFNPDLTYETIADIEGNMYRTIQIGSQIWMAENLKTTKYNNNTSIELTTSNASWHSLSTPLYCWYNNDPINFKNSYGALYNWHAVNTGMLCPSGWHVPSDEEWKTLEMSLGMTRAQADSQSWRGIDQGTQLKSLGSWNGTNTSGFSALPGGLRSSADGYFYDIHNNGFWWSSTKYSETNANYRSLQTDYSNVARHLAGPMKLGFSVRCIKD